MKYSPYYDPLQTLVERLLATQAAPRPVSPKKKVREAKQLWDDIVNIVESNQKTMKEQYETKHKKDNEEDFKKKKERFSMVKGIYLWLLFVAMGPFVGAAYFKLFKFLIQ